MNAIYSDIDDFGLDCVFVKCSKIPKPLKIIWIEVADGQYVPEESTEEEIVILTKPPSSGTINVVVTKQTAEGEEPPKTRLRKKALIKYLESKLSEGEGGSSADFGSIEDIRMQPAGRNMTKEVFLFLAKYGAV